jgi:hypothetical protein
MGCDFTAKMQTSSTRYQCFQCSRPLPGLASLRHCRRKGRNCYRWQRCTDQDFVEDLGIVGAV